jgi:hypothetical protein
MSETASGALAHAWAATTFRLSSPRSLSSQSVPVPTPIRPRANNPTTQVLRPLATDEARWRIKPIAARNWVVGLQFGAPLQVALTNSDAAKAPTAGSSALSDAASVSWLDALDVARNTTRSTAAC